MMKNFFTIPFFHLAVLSQVQAGAPEATRLFGNDSVRRAELGSSVALSGNTALVGAPYQDNSGAVYVFVKTDGEWSEQAKLLPSNPDIFDQFGWSVDLDGDIAVIGAPEEDGDATEVDGTQNNEGNNTGAAYVYVRNGENWEQAAYLKSDSDFGQQGFGTSVAISGNSIVVGSPHTSIPGFSSPGAAFVFTEGEDGWSRTQRLAAHFPGTDDEFGHSVAIDGDSIVVGAPHEDSLADSIDGEANNDGNDSGAAYLFSKMPDGWSMTAYFKAKNTENRDDQFGHSVAISGDRILIGAPMEDSGDRFALGINDNRNNNSGAAYLFTNTDEVWNQVQFLKAPQVTSGDEFGHAVDFDGDMFIIGAPLDSRRERESGAIHVYKPGIARWFAIENLKTPAPQASAQFGYSVAISGDQILAGARLEDRPESDLNDTSGAAYVQFVDQPTPPVVIKDVRMVGRIMTIDYFDDCELPTILTSGGPTIPLSFSEDLGPVSEFLHGPSPGVRSVRIDLSGKPDRYFVRLDRVLN